MAAFGVANVLQQANETTVDFQVMAALKAELVNRVASQEGPQADVLLTEPNGDSHVIRCLVKRDRTDIGGESETLAYLNQRYGSAQLVEIARGVVLESK